MCLVAPSAIGLQKLIDVCQQYDVHNKVYHPVKSMCMTILPKSVNSLIKPEYC